MSEVSRPPDNRKPPPVTSRSAGSARVKAEGPVRLDEVWKLFPLASSSTGYASVTTLLRWVIGGKCGVRLDAARVNGEWHTSVQACQRFWAAVHAMGGWR
jgi:Protein of unknown function (DUF1580)